MGETWQKVVELFADEKVTAVVKAVVVVLVGLAAARWVSRGVTQMLSRRLDKQQEMLLRRSLFYPIAGLALLGAIRELGIDMSVFLGAAGILTVAVGFASQTSASNVISGLFLLGERPFVVGDVITVETTTGEVLSIDLLSVKLRTFDNLYVRVPNELLIKSSITNLSRFPIRRIDLDLRVAYGEDLDRVREILHGVVDRLPACLAEPRPVYFAQDFGESSVLLRFSVWSRREVFVQTKADLQSAIRRAFEEHDVRVPSQNRALEGRRGAEPLVVRLVRDGSAT